MYPQDSGLISRPRGAGAGVSNERTCAKTRLQHAAKLAAAAHRCNNNWKTPCPWNAPALTLSPARGRRRRGAALLGCLGAPGGPLSFGVPVHHLQGQIHRLSAYFRGLGGFDCRATQFYKTAARRNPETDPCRLWPRRGHLPSEAS